MDVMDWLMDAEDLDLDERDLSLVVPDAAFGNHVHILDWLEINFPGALDRHDHEVAESAAASGALDALMWLRKRKFNMMTVKRTAAKLGRSDVLEWARANRRAN